jgi:hypothetical protein
VFPAAGATDYSCWDIGTVRCLRADRWLLTSLAEVRRVTTTVGGREERTGEWLLKVAAEHGVTIGRGELGLETSGRYRPADRRIELNFRYDAYSAWVRAGVLAHELQHAVDDAAGALAHDRRGCFVNEDSAFRREALVWRWLWKDRLPRAGLTPHDEHNHVVDTIARDPIGFAKELLPLYDRQCG